MKFSQFAGEQFHWSLEVAKQITEFLMMDFLIQEQKVWFYPWSEI